MNFEKSLHIQINYNFQLSKTFFFVTCYIQIYYNFQLSKILFKKESKGNFIEVEKKNTKRGNFFLEIYHKLINFIVN